MIFWRPRVFLLPGALQSLAKVANIRLECHSRFSSNRLWYRLLRPKMSQLSFLNFRCWIFFTSSFFSIISIRNSGSEIVLSSGNVTPCSLNKYSPRSSGDCRVLYALLISELHSELKFCSLSLFPENLSGWIWLWKCRNFVVRAFASMVCFLSNPNKLK